MIKGYPDVPVGNRSQDLFEVGIYIDSMAEFIKSCNTPMTIAIQGDWGSGKTSMMNMIRESLGDSVVPVWFNTWQYSQFDMSSNLPISLLTFLTESIGNEKNKKDMREAVIKLLRFTSKVVLENLAGSTAASALDGSEDPTNYARSIDELKRQFGDTVKSRLSGQKQDRVVIFVDDLDRLSPEIAVELLEVLKLFLDVDHCVFVLAVDYDVVSQGIRKKFGDMVSVDKGRSFFDKIIQLPFRVPIGLYDLDKYVSSTLNDFGIAASQVDLATYKRLIIHSIGQNPRSMKRLFNAYQLIRAISSRQQVIVKSSHRDRVLFAILCMQMAYEDLYDYLLSSRASFMDKEFFQFESAEGLGERIYDNITERQAKALPAMHQFMEIFLEAIQLDEDKDLSDKEIEFLTEILSFSAITASGSGVVQPEVARKKTFETMLESLTPNQKQRIVSFRDSWLAMGPEFNIEMGTSGFSAKYRDYPMIWVFADKLHVARVFGKKAKSPELQELLNRLIEQNLGKRTVSFEAATYEQQNLADLLSAVAGQIIPKLP